MAKVRVLVADGETLFRESVCALLKGCEDIEVAGEATNGRETIKRARELAADVVLVNMAMPSMDGAEVTHWIHKEGSDIKVLLLVQDEDGHEVLSGLKAGADGYITKRATASDLVSTILAIYRGGYILHPSVAKMVVNDYLQRINQPGSPDAHDKLTHREVQVLKLVADGHKSKEIANLLDITARTAERHRANVMRKLSIHNRTELIKYAMRKHLINLES